MDKESIDLSYSYDVPVSAMGMDDDDEPKKMYPKLCITSDKPIDFPEGRFAFASEGRVVERVERTEDEPHFRYEVEVCCIQPGEVVGESKVSKDPVEEFEKALNGENEED